MSPQNILLLFMIVIGCLSLIVWLMKEPTSRYTTNKRFYSKTIVYLIRNSQKLSFLKRKENDILILLFVPIIVMLCSIYYPILYKDTNLIAIVSLTMALSSLIISISIFQMQRKTEFQRNDIIHAYKEHEIDRI